MESKTARTLEEARQLGGELHTLIVTKEWTTPWQSVLPEFPALQRLELQSGVGADPRGVTSWPQSLVELELMLPDLGTALQPWLEALPGLEVLELWGGQEPTRLTSRIGRSSRLRELSIVSSGLSELPRELRECEGLSKLALCNLPLPALPEVVCQLPALLQLIFQCRVPDLPEALADLRRLEVLDLTGALNEGAVDAHERPAHFFRPLPPVIARLPLLRELIVDECGIFERDVEALAGHEGLRTLSLRWGGIEDLTSVRALPALRELCLESCHNVHDLRPLAGTRLEGLSLASSSIRDVSPILDIPSLRRLDIRDCDDLQLGPVLAHAGLETLEAEDEVLERWQRRRGTREDVSASAILQGLEDEDPAVLEAALRSLVSFCDDHAHAEHNPVYELFEVEPDANGGQTPAPALSCAVRHPALPGALLAEVVRATFRSMEDSLEPIVHAVEAIVERRDVEAQKAVVEAFLAAGEHYDPGHRAHESTVQDAFIDDLFPRFHPDALAELLSRLPDDALEGARGGDGMDRLFAPALSGATPESTARTIDRLRRYIEESQSYVGEDYVLELLDQLQSVSPRVGAELAGARASLEVVVGWKRQLEEASEARDTAMAVAALERLVRAVGSGELALERVAFLGRAVPACLRACGRVPAPLARVLLRLSFETDQSSWHDRFLLMPLVEADFAQTIGSVLDEHGPGGERPEHRREQMKEALERLANEAEGVPAEQRLLEALALLTGRSSEVVATELAAQGVARALRNGGGEQIEAALDRFLSRPSALSIGGDTTRLLALGYEGLYEAEEWERLGRIADKLRKALLHLSWEVKHQQYALTYPLVAAVHEGPAFFDAHVAPWLELHQHEIVEPRFAFNLACYYARRGADEAALISAVRRALELGKPAAQFIHDEDFAAHLRKPALRQLLGLPPVGVR